jgi:exonuclease SbcC
VIDLQRVRGLAAAAPPQRLRPPRPVAVPEPTGDAAAFGAAIGAPPLDATRDLGAVHLFHLLRDDLPLLAALLRRRIERQGQLATFAAELRADGTLDPAAWRLLTARTRAMAAFLDAYAIGRGRPVPAGAISRDSGVDTTKLAEIDALATRLGGAADRLVQALEAGEVKRLQQAKKDEIADWLARAGYLDRRPVLDRDEVRRRVVRELQSAPDPGVLDWPALEPLFAAWWTAAADAGTAAT